MTDTAAEAPATVLDGDGGATPTLTNACESCGTHEARYVVADLVERDTSLFCPACIVLTFAKVASQIGGM